MSGAVSSPPRGGVNPLTGRCFSERYYRLREQRQALPMFRERAAVIEAVRTNQVVLLVGETGSGKTTQLPQFFVEQMALELCQQAQLDEAQRVASWLTTRTDASGLAFASPAHCPEVSIVVDQETKSIRVTDSTTGREVCAAPPVARAGREALRPTLCGRSARIACTQPRRVAAMSIAQRVAEECDVELGEEVGYHVRFQSMKSDAKTMLLYLTDGMLVREAQSDPDFKQYSLLVVDEAHERTVDTDILLGMVKRLTEKGAAVAGREPRGEGGRVFGGELKIVIMSATLDVATFQKFFPTAPLLHVAGRLHSVKLMYAPSPVADYVTESVHRVCDLHQHGGPGDILCFLTGQAEIERAVNLTKQRLSNAYGSEGLYLAEDSAASSRKRARELGGEKGFCAGEPGPAVGPQHALVLPLYGSLNLDEQQRVFVETPANTRKIIFATNIAETSVTIDGIVFVVDCGYQKEMLYDAHARTDCLLPSVISRANANQRSGRAGRTLDGVCYRLFTEKEFEFFPPQAFPQILRSNLTNTLLLMLQLGIDNPFSFSFIDAPSQQAFLDAFLELSYLGIVDDDGRLTADIGVPLASFAFVDCALGRMLLRSPLYGCADDVAVVVAMREAVGTGGSSVFLRPPGAAREADERREVFSSTRALLRFLQCHDTTGPLESSPPQCAPHDTSGSPEVPSDHLALFRVFHAFMFHGQTVRFCRERFVRYSVLAQAVHVYNQIRRAMHDRALSMESRFRAALSSQASAPSRPKDESFDVMIRKAMLEGFFTRVAFQPAGATAFKIVKGTSAPGSLTGGHMATLHPSSSLAGPSRPGNAHGDRSAAASRSRWIFFDRLEVQGKEGAQIRMATEIQPQWLIEVNREYFEPSEIGDGEIAVVLERLYSR